MNADRLSHTAGRLTRTVRHLLPVIRCLLFAVRRSPSVVRRPPFVVRRPPSVVRRPPSAVIRHSSFVILSLLLLAACNPSGVANLSAAGGAIAVIGSGDLYVVSNSAPDISAYASRPDTRFAPAITPDGKSVVYVDASHRLVRQPLDRGALMILLTEVGRYGPGVMAFLPNGELFLLDTAFGEKLYVKIVNTETGVVSQYLSDIEQVFVTANALKLKSPDSPTAARLEASAPGQLRVVFQARTYLYMYSGTADGFVFDGQPPRVLTVEDQILLARRVENDVTSGLLTSDGRYAILRLRVPFDRAQSLYALDLTTDALPIPLLEDASGRPNYAVAPDGDWLAYEEVINGVSQVQLYNLTTGEKTTLGVGAFDPQWWK